MEEDQVPNKDVSQPKDVKKEQHEPKPKRYSEIFRDFDKLDLSILSCEGDDLLADSTCSESTSAESAAQHDVSIHSEANEVDGNSTAQDADLALCRCEDGVETALHYAKMWCRYSKDLLGWMEKRINLEQEFAKNVMKTAEGAKANMTQQEMMPLQYLYTMALEQDVKNSLNSKKIYEMMQHRCYQSLTAKKNEIDKWRREFKDQWAREQRKMNEAVVAFKKARHQYFQRCDELEKAKAVTAKAVDDIAGIKTLDKRKKSKDEAHTKMIEAELQYRQSASDATTHWEELVKVKERIISHIRKLICQGDTVLKEATVNMFYYQRQQTEPVPLGYHNLEMTCRSLEPGESYLLYVLSRRRPEQPPQVFAFQEYFSQAKGKRKTSNPHSFVYDASSMTDDSPSKSSSDGRKTGYGDNDSFGGSLESLSSPAHTQRRLPKTSSTLTVSSDDLDERDLASESDYFDSQPVKVRNFAVLTHRLRKMKSKMGKCKQCENYIVVNGVECEECGLALHRKCLEVCQLECENRKGTMFGVDLSLLLRDKQDLVPFVVLHCTSEIESRALSVQGVYRVSGSKPRIQKLCQAFETQKEQVDLSDHSPHDITSIIKHFFKELPEPLLTFDLYSDFIMMGKAIQHLNDRETAPDTNDIMEIVHDLQGILHKLPPYCYNTLKYMMCHLQKVSLNEENKMSPSNLGIVFGPTLLRPLVSTDVSMIALLENSYQALLVQFLIAHYDKIFCLLQRPSTPPPPVPNAPLPETPPRASCPLDGETNSGPEHETPSKERPQSLTTRTIKRESSEGYISDKSSSNEAVDQLSPEANERAVLAMRGESSNIQGEPVRKPDSVLVTQPHYRFTRQPVKYYRHNQGTRLSNLGRAARQPAALARSHPGSADSSRSSSPESGAQRLSQNLDVSCENTCQPHQATTVAENKVDLPLSPAKVAQYMLGLDSAVTSIATATPSGTTQEFSQEAVVWCHSDVNIKQSNNRQGAGHSRALCQSPKSLPIEHKLTSPAQKILSGLKLKRSQSGKDEQLFV